LNRWKKRPPVASTGRFNRYYRRSVQKYCFDAFCRKNLTVLADTAACSPGAVAIAATPHPPACSILTVLRQAQAIQRQFFGMENGADAFYVSASALKPFY
jgi:hypothetical protein